MTQCIVTLIKVTCEIWSFPGDNVPYTIFGNTITAPIHTEEEFMMLFTTTVNRMKLVLSGIEVHPGPNYSLMLCNGEPLDDTSYIPITIVCREC